jgi:hypothetical protein
MRLRHKIDVPSVTMPEFVEPKQSIMYWTEDGEPDHLYTVAYLQDSTVDRIAKRVVELIAQMDRDVIDMNPPKKRGKK